MSDFLRRINRTLKKTYLVTVEISLDGMFIHQAEVAVEEYNRHRARRKAMREVEKMATVTAVSIKRLK